jgi:hypothetical protein
MLRIASEDERRLPSVVEGKPRVSSHSRRTASVAQLGDFASCQLQAEARTISRVSNLTHTFGTYRSLASSSPESSYRYKDLRLQKIMLML